jgi:hypothetical protein
MEARSRLAVCALVAALAVIGCGGGDDNGTGAVSDAAPSQPRLTGPPAQRAMGRSIAKLGAAIDRGDASAVCASLSMQARDQLKRVGHGISESCAAGLRMLLKGVRKTRRTVDYLPAVKAVDPPRPTRRAVATVSVEGRSIRIPFVKDGRLWKVDSFFGLAPQPSVKYD